MYTWVYINIYIYKEREREKERYVGMSSYTHTPFSYLACASCFVNVCRTQPNMYIH
jgi:hypothetical protein